MAEKKATKTKKEAVSAGTKTAKVAKKPVAPKKTVKTEKVETTAKSVKTEKKEATVVISEEKKSVSKAAKSTLTVTVFDTKGKEVETISLPEEIFGAKINKVLLAQ